MIAGGMLAVNTFLTPGGVEPDAWAVLTRPVVPILMTGDTRG